MECLVIVLNLELNLFLCDNLYKSVACLIEDRKVKNFSLSTVLTMVLQSLVLLFNFPLFPALRTEPIQNGFVPTQKKHEAFEEKEAKGSRASLDAVDN